MAKGALNHCSKFAHDLKMLGSKKFNNAHNSGNLFCNQRIADSDNSKTYVTKTDTKVTRTSN